jgi:hypothetical protein
MKGGSKVWFTQNLKEVFMSSKEDMERELEEVNNDP